MNIAALSPSRVSKVEHTVALGSGTKSKYVKPDISFLGSFDALTNAAASGPQNDGRGYRP